MSSKKAKTEKTELEKRLEAQAAAEAEGRKIPIDDAMEAQQAEAAPSEDVAALTAERDELKDQLLRARAEYENARKRMARDVERIRKTAAEGLIMDLLPVLDHLDLALQHAEDPTGGFAQGVEMVLKQFCEALEKHGVEPIPAVGEPFDPNVHEALMQQASDDVPEGCVIEEYQKGYRMGDTILRASRVVVSMGAQEDSGDPSGGDAAEEPDNTVSASPEGAESDEDTTLVDL